MGILDLAFMVGESERLEGESEPKQVCVMGPGAMEDGTDWMPKDLQYDEFDYKARVALTVMPPWPWAMFNGDAPTDEPSTDEQVGWPCKDVENRTWAPSQEIQRRIADGKEVWIAIHQGKGEGELKALEDWTDEDDELEPHMASMVHAAKTGPATWYNGHMVGVVRLVGLLGAGQAGKPVVTAPGFETIVQLASMSAWHDPDQFGWVLTSRRRCRPTPARGMLGLWTVDQATRQAMSEP